MIRIYFFGTCSGTEPMPGRKHTSFAIDYNNFLYWFDAGEGCSYTAHNMCVGIERTRKICISHTHMDHVGGLANLFWNIRKLDVMYNNFKSDKIDLYIPNLETWDGIDKILRNTEGAFDCSFKINVFPISDGKLFSDDGINTFSLHNRHLGIPTDGIWRSFSFAIEAENKKIVYSGDYKDLSDIIPLLNGCDLLLCETGHHSADGTLIELDKLNLLPKKIAFLHHGMAILKNPECERQKAQKIYKNAVILSDGDIIEI